MKKKPKLNQVLRKRIKEKYGVGGQKKVSEMLGLERSNFARWLSVNSYGEKDTLLYLCALLNLPVCLKDLEDEYNFSLHKERRSLEYVTSIIVDGGRTSPVFDKKILQVTMNVLKDSFFDFDNNKTGAELFIGKVVRNLPNHAVIYLSDSRELLVKSPDFKLQTIFDLKLIFPSL